MKREPLIEKFESTDAVYGDPVLAKRLSTVLEGKLGRDDVEMEEPWTASEDFSYFVEQGIPGFYFDLGGADPEKYAEAKRTGVSLPSDHSSLFAPDVDPAVHTGIAEEIAVLQNLLSGSAQELRKSLQTASTE